MILPPVLPGHSRPSPRPPVSGRPGWLLLALALRFIAFDEAAAAPLPRSATGRNLDAMLEAIRAEFRLPALACLVLHSNQIVSWGCVGVRKLGDPTPATLAAFLLPARP